MTFPCILVSRADNEEQFLYHTESNSILACLLILSIMCLILALYF